MVAYNIHSQEGAPAAERTHRSGRGFCARSNRPREGLRRRREEPKRCRIHGGAGTAGTVEAATASGAASPAGRFLAVLLCFLLVTAFVPAEALAAPPEAAASSQSLSTDAGDGRLLSLEMVPEDGSGNTVEFGADETGESDYHLRYVDSGKIDAKVELADPADKAWFVVLQKGSVYPSVRRKSVTLGSWQSLTCSDQGQVLYLVIGPEPPLLNEVDKGIKNKAVNGASYEDLLANIRWREDVNSIYVISHEQIQQANLTKLALKDLELFPAFSTAVRAYEAEVPYDAAQIQIQGDTNGSSGYADYVSVRDFSGVEVEQLQYVTAARYTDLPIGDGTALPWDASGRLTLTLVPTIQIAGGDAVEGEPYYLTLKRSRTPLFLTWPKAPVTVREDRQASSNLTVTVGNAGGEMTYQWYRAEAEDGEGVPVEGATATTFIPPAVSLPNTVFPVACWYYCVAMNCMDGETYTAASPRVRYEVVPAPSIPLMRADGQPAASPWVAVAGEPQAALTPDFEESTYTSEEGAWSYQWYDKGKPIEGATGRQWEPVLYGDEFHQITCAATFTAADGRRGTLTSSAKAIYTHFLTPDAPVITSSPEDVSYFVGQDSESLKVTAKWTRSYHDEGASYCPINCQYRWERSDDGEHYTAVDASTSRAYRPPTDAEGTFYYRAWARTVYTNRNGDILESDWVASEPARVTVVKYRIDLEGDGTREHPYLLQSAADMDTLRRAVNEDEYGFDGEYFLMTGPVKLSEGWTPIGKNPRTYFRGSIDGGGNLLTVPEGGLPLLGYTSGASLSNMDIYGPRIEGYGVVQNYVVGTTISITNVTLKTGTSTLYSGFLGGFASGTDVINIRGCTVEPGVTIGYDRSQSHIGSFAGEFNGYMDGCVSYADVYGTDWVGGLVANKGQTMGPCAVRNSTFAGTVHATGSFVGGILGAGYAGTYWGLASAPNTPCATVQNCVVSGAVSGGDCVGGIFGGEPGCWSCWENGIGYIQNNLFAGTVFASGGESGIALQAAYADGKPRVGAIIGYMQSLNANNVVSNNYFSENCGSHRGIGYAAFIVTSHSNPDRSDPNVEYAEAADSPRARSDDPLGADAAALCEPVGAETLLSQGMVDRLNSGTGTFGNWVRGDSGPELSKDAVLIALEVTDVYQIEYHVGDLFDSRCTVTGIYSDGTTREFLPSETQMTGFDSRTKGFKTITVSIGSVSTSFAVRVLAPEAQISVRIAVLGDTSHSPQDGVHTLKADTLTPWLPEAELTVSTNSTVKDVVEAVLRGAGCTWENPSGNYISSITKDGVTLREMGNGAPSGWMYTLNGVHSNLGVAEQILNEGDVIVVHWTDDYMLETPIGGEGALTADDVIAMIDAIGEVTLEKSSAIYAARAAFDSLDESEQPRVANILALVAAEARLRSLMEPSLGPDSGLDLRVSAAHRALARYVASRTPSPQSASVGGEWAVIGLARSGSSLLSESAKDAYVRNAVSAVAQSEGVLDEAKYTEYSRMVLGLTAVGYNVTDVAGYNLLDYLADYDKVCWQGINGPLWALIALDSHDYAVPATGYGAVRTTREKLVSVLLDAQLADGGWALSGTAADPDMTAMAVMALAPYRSQNAQVAAAVSHALSRLSSLQNSTGGYASWDSVNSESCAQVICALCAVGIDPARDVRFSKNGISVVDALLTFAVDGGGFAHVHGGGANGMASEQVLYALAAYERFVQGKNRLFAMGDVAIDSSWTVEPGSSDDPEEGKPEDPENPEGGDEPTDPSQGENPPAIQEPAGAVIGGIGGSGAGPSGGSAAGIGGAAGTGGASGSASGIASAGAGAMSRVLVSAGGFDPAMTAGDRGEGAVSAADAGASFSGEFAAADRLPDDGVPLAAGDTAPSLADRTLWFWVLAAVLGWGLFAGAAIRRRRAEAGGAVAGAAQMASAANPDSAIAATVEPPVANGSDPEASNSPHGDGGIAVAAASAAAQSPSAPGERA